MDASTVRIKFKNLVAQRAYNKKWDELSIAQQNKLRSKHKQQFETLSRKAIKEMSNKSDHDILIRLDERVERIDKWCSNHDTHHFRYNILAWSVAAGAIVTLAIALIKVL